MFFYFNVSEFCYYIVCLVRWCYWCLLFVVYVLWWFVYCCLSWYLGLLGVFCFFVGLVLLSDLLCLLLYCLLLCLTVCFIVVYFGWYFAFSLLFVYLVCGCDFFVCGYLVCWLWLVQLGWAVARCVLNWFDYCFWVVRLRMFVCIVVLWYVG